MTTEIQNQPKKVPDFAIYGKSGDGKNQQAGVVFKHGKGGGFNIVIGEKRYSAFPVRTKT